MNENKLNEFKIGYGYDIMSVKGGSVNIECISRTTKTVTFEYEDGETVTKRINIHYGFSTDYEYVTFDKIIVKA